MYYEKIDHTRRELTLTLTQQDCNDLGYACCVAERAANGDGLDNDPALAHRFNLMLTTFMVAFEALAPAGNGDDGEG